MRYKKLKEEGDSRAKLRFLADAKSVLIVKILPTNESY